ncbi:energy transducer TonB [Paludibaculum fermentans]|uniref:energy transducer TonB n=1 Tax=Paludibaculum fermentans TaxID=1473598 RepID=UPI003EBF7A8D
MLRCLLLRCLTSLLAQAADRPGPSELYVVSASFSDHGLQFYYRLIDVKQDGPDSVIRYIRVAPDIVHCPRMIVQATEARVSGKTPAQLVGQNNPCAVNPDTLRAALRESKENQSVFEAASYGVVAQCGETSISLGLPIAQEVDMEQLQSAHPALARLWSLASEITEAAFGNKDVFRDPSEAEDLALQQAGEKLVPELRAGRYDRGLMEARSGNVGSAEQLSFRAILSDYNGPITASQAKRLEEPKLQNAAVYRFTNFITPSYPRLALQAQISGEVEFVLKVNPETGEVLKAEAAKGHRLLGQSAIEAARRWRFEPGSLKGNSLNVTIDYALPCRK